MSSPLGRKLGYIRERVVNAFWMVRKGDFDLIVKSVLMEINHRIEAFHNWMSERNELDDSQVPGSAYFNRRKVLPESYRPTVSQIREPQDLKVDSQEVAQDLQQILSSFKVAQP
jgi:hypothetical protein